MFNKALIAAAAVSILASGFASSAEAASSTQRDHRSKVIARDHRAPDVRDHRTKDELRDHRSQRRNEVVKVNRAKQSCNVGKQKLRWSGYKSVKAFDCKGTSYSYRAKKGHGIFQATMNAYSGKMHVKFVGIAH
ncbi:hypothetical protein IMCC20628_03809 [Hoeflea sp. IMCC20628]|uniref:hypothetical protein n=1 Tax=Hoeflea sp. IMCC20628 TaxID=1620421 RepID=UPI00063AA280|nr:hypothetical protein [Hoeflea sp. IMCC20628]AKI02491.1 hypothetical protein IMCC20628_03809 [Hoeflea sp. IMCC20628]